MRSDASQVQGEVVAEERDSWLHSLYHEAQLSPAGGERLGREHGALRPGWVWIEHRSWWRTTSLTCCGSSAPSWGRSTESFRREMVGKRFRRRLKTQPSVIVLDTMMPEMDGIARLPGAPTGGGHRAHSHHHADGPGR